MRMLSEDERVIFAIVGSLAGVLLVATATFYCIVRARRQRLAATLRLFQQCQKQVLTVYFLVPIAQRSTLRLMQRLLCFCVILLKSILYDTSLSSILYAP